MKKIILLSALMFTGYTAIATAAPGMSGMNNRQMGGQNQMMGMNQMGGNQQFGNQQFGGQPMGGTQQFGGQQMGGNQQFGSNQQFGGMTGNSQPMGRMLESGGLQQFGGQQFGDMNGNDQQQGNMPQFGGQQFGGMNSNDQQQGNMPPQMGGSNQDFGGQQFGGMNGNDQQQGNMPQFGGQQFGGMNGNDQQQGGMPQFGGQQFGGMNGNDQQQGGMPPQMGGKNIDILDGSDFGRRPEDFDQDSDDNSNNNDIVSDSNATKLYDVNGNEIKAGSASVNFNGSNKTINAAYLINGVEVEIASGTYASKSNSSNQVVFLVINGGKLTIEGDYSNPVIINKEGSAASNGQVNDNYNFYGINSAIVVAGDESGAEIKYATINTSANGSNAVVSTANANVTISDSIIQTTGSAGSRGLHATYGGTINANNVNISTQGGSSAALATDRGSGTINAENMTLETNSAGSPLVYSTGIINVTSSKGSANGAQMVVVEGGSSATITECEFSCSGNGNRSGTSESNSDNHVIDAAGIFIYQSFSGDSSIGTDYFTAVDSTFTINESNIPMFFITNITAKINLSGNTFDYSSDYFIIAEETDQWGKVGSNGGKATLTLTNQNLSGENAFVGESSSYLKTNSSSGSTGLTIENGTW
ncbi:MAG: hypothetical protein IKO19_12330 [Candidatus Riflebacteria bacterium]|nr:hypothetical protein [Candidatus Riflebacteria bacterium]